MDDEGRPLDFSNWGENYQVQGVLAPGKDISCAVSGGGIAERSGTSIAMSLHHVGAELFGVDLHDHEVWLDAAKTIDTYRERWNVGRSAEPLGVARDQLAGLAPARLADHLTAEGMKAWT